MFVHVKYKHLDDWYSCLQKFHTHGKLIIFITAYSHSCFCLINQTLLLTNEKLLPNLVRSTYSLLLEGSLPKSPPLYQNFCRQLYDGTWNLKYVAMVPVLVAFLDHDFSYMYGPSVLHSRRSLLAASGGGKGGCFHGPLALSLALCSED